MRPTTRQILAAAGCLALVLTACGAGDTATEAALDVTLQGADDEAAEMPAAGGALDAGAEADAAAPLVDEDPAAPEGERGGIESVVFDDHGVAGWVDTGSDAVSTFRTDATVGSYRVAESWLVNGVLPPAEGVRAEEWINALDHGYPAPAGDEVWAVHADAGAPWWQTGPDAPANTRLLRVGLRATDGVGERPPASITFVIDVSGSMETDDRLDTVVEVLGRSLDRLDERDQVAIVTFHDDARLELAHTSDYGQVRDVLAGLRPLNATNTGAGVVLGHETAAEGHREGDHSSVVVLADGMANEGVTDPRQIVERLDEVGGPARIVTHTVGIGREVYNDALLSTLANESGGTYAYIDRSDQADRLFDRDLPLLWPVAHDVKTQVTFEPSSVRAWRLIGYESRALAAEDFRDDAVTGAYVGAGHAVTAIYELDLAVEGGTGGELGQVQVRWADPRSGDVSEMEVPLPAALATEESGSATFGQAAAMTALVEALRGSPHALVNLQQVADQADGELAALVEASRAAFQGAPAQRREFVQP
ncbi:von Willebrand factor type A domain-containing protein [Egicoccus sp. AB-alg2]|uniref:vWA domain-containing protein n=1 Tax=Egicoccus sp. AB-alg2 TaxID=3242693 RepID=UPI00359EB2D0